jgi:hypothetical protein
MANIKPIYANKATKKAHDRKNNDSCRLSEILPKNRIYFANVEEAEEYGYVKCRKCYKEEETGG